MNKKKEVVALLGGKCVACGLVDEHYVYDIDHIDRRDKTFSPSSFISRRDKKLWMKEVLEKCQLLCANCHRKKTQKEHLETSAFGLARGST